MPTPRFRKLAAARLATAEPISPAVSALFDGEGGASALSTRQVPVARLSPMPGQPHRTFNPATLTALAQSISEHGVLEPILVRPIGGGGYQIIAGERRWRAAILAGLERIPAVIREMDDLTALQTAIGETLAHRVETDAAAPVFAAPLVETAFAPITAPAVAPVVVAPVVTAPVVTAPIVETVVTAPVVAAPIVETVVAAPVVAAPVVAAPVVAAPVVTAPIVETVVTTPLVTAASETPAPTTSETLETAGEDDLLDRIGAIWSRARELGEVIDRERGDLSSYDRERARKALLSIRIAADNGAALLRD